MNILIKQDKSRERQRNKKFVRHKNHSHEYKRFSLKFKCIIFLLLKVFCDQNVDLQKGVYSCMLKNIIIYINIIFDIYNR